MTRFYLAGPLFCQSEKDYNMELRVAFAEQGYDLILPQDNPTDIDSSRMSDPEYAAKISKEVYSKDLALLDSCDALVFNLDGRVPDEGACVELGYSLAKGKPCFGLKTDVRTAEYGIDNMMISGPLNGRIARNLPELFRMIKGAGLRAPL